MASENSAQLSNTPFNLAPLAYLTEASSLPDGALLELACRIEKAAGKHFLLDRWQSEPGIRKAISIIGKCSSILPSSLERRKLLDRSLLRDPLLNAEKSGYTWLRKECHAPMLPELFPGLTWRVLLFPFWIDQQNGNQEQASIFLAAIEPVSQTLLLSWTPIQTKTGDASESGYRLKQLKKKDFFGAVLKQIERISNLGIDQRIEILVKQNLFIDESIVAALEKHIGEIPRLTHTGTQKGHRIEEQCARGRRSKEVQISLPTWCLNPSKPTQINIIQNRINATTNMDLENDPRLYKNQMETLRASPVGRLALLILQIQGKSGVPYEEQWQMLKTIWAIVRKGKARFARGWWPHPYDSRGLHLGKPKYRKPHDKEWAQQWHRWWCNSPHI